MQGCKSWHTYIVLFISAYIHYVPAGVTGAGFGNYMHVLHACVPLLLGQH